MPRIFELRSCLQEVQDSILGDVAADDIEAVSSAGRQISNPKDLWFDVRQPYLGSEQDVINIPGKTCFSCYYVATFLLFLIDMD